MSTQFLWHLIPDLCPATGRRWRLRHAGHLAEPGDVIRDVLARSPSGLLCRVPVAVCVSIHHQPEPETECEVTSAVWVLSIG